MRTHALIVLVVIATCSIATGQDASLLANGGFEE